MQVLRPIAVVALLGLGPGVSLAQLPPLSVESLRAEADPEDPTRLLVSTETLVEDVPGAIDQQLRSIAASASSCSRRPRVRGTRITGGGGTLRLSTAFRYEQWTCIGPFKTRLFSLSFRVDWSLQVSQPAALDNLVLTAEAGNIEGVPGEVEQYFDLPGRLRREIWIALPTDCGQCRCSDLVESLEPIVRQTLFDTQNGEDDVIVRTVLSMRSDLTPLTQCAF